MNAMRLFDVAITAVFALVGIGAIAYLRIAKRKSFAYLVIFGIFYASLFKVLDYTLIQFQSLVLLRYFVPGLMLNGHVAGDELNLIPLATLTGADLRTSLLNVLLFVPFGFGLPALTRLCAGKVIAYGMLASVGIELLQLATGLIAHVSFRIADVNDVLFNTLGAAIGYAAFVAFSRIARMLKQ